jgi:hypothetical protein
MVAGNDPVKSRKLIFVKSADMELCSKIKWKTVQTLSSETALKIKLVLRSDSIEMVGT